MSGSEAYFWYSPFPLKTPRQRLINLSPTCAPFTSHFTVNFYSDPQCLWDPISLFPYLQDRLPNNGFHDPSVRTCAQRLTYRTLDITHVFHFQNYPVGHLQPPPPPGSVAARCIVSHHDGADTRSMAMWIAPQEKQRMQGCRWGSRTRGGGGHPPIIPTNQCTFRSTVLCRNSALGRSCNQRALYMRFNTSLALLLAASSGQMWAVLTLQSQHITCFGTTPHSSSGGWWGRY